MDYYDSISKGYEELHREEQEKKIKIILQDKWLRNITSDSDLKMLDVGCGTGIFFESIDLPAKQKVGIDPSKELIDIAKKKGNGTYSVGNAESLPYKDNEFDIVVSLTAIQNFTEIKQGLDEIKRVGKKENCLFTLTFLKKSGKNKQISELIEKIFKVVNRIEEDKDVIYFCE